MDIEMRLRQVYQARDSEEFATGLDHPEGLAFDAEGILWAGGEAGQIYRMDLGGKVKEVAALGGFCLGITVTPEQDLWVCNAGLRMLQRVSRDGRVTESIEKADGCRLINPNYSVIDANDNLYFTDSGTWDGANGHVYRLAPSGVISHIAGPLRFPNGMALSAQEDMLFVVESQTDSVLVIALVDGHPPSPAEVYVSGLARVPDGLALDERGNLYVACYASDAIYCVTPGREVRLLIHDPEATRVARPTTIAFGGPQHEDLYVANFGRWHIGRLHLGIPGQRLNGERKR
jgi:gluconolactonase